MASERYIAEPCSCGRVGCETWFVVDSVGDRQNRTIAGLRGEADASDYATYRNAALQYPEIVAQFGNLLRVMHELRDARAATASASQHGRLLAAADWAVATLNMARRDAARESEVRS